MTVYRGGRKRLTDDMEAGIFKFMQVVIKMRRFIANMIGAVFISAHKTGYDGILGKWRDEFNIQAVFRKKAYVDAASGIMCHFAAFVAKHSECVCSLVYFFD